MPRLQARSPPEPRSPARSGTRDGGLYSGYFTDPEGNGWEIVWSPVMRPGADGGLDLKLP